MLAGSSKLLVDQLDPFEVCFLVQVCSGFTLVRFIPNTPGVSSKCTACSMRFLHHKWLELGWLPALSEFWELFSLQLLVNCSFTHSCFFAWFCGVLPHIWRNGYFAKDSRATYADFWSSFSLKLSPLWYFALQIQAVLDSPNSNIIFLNSLRSCVLLGFHFYTF